MSQIENNIHIYIYVYVIDKFVVRFSIRNLNATDTKQMDSTKMQFPQFECVFVPMISDSIIFLLEWEYRTNVGLFLLGEYTLIHIHIFWLSTYATVVSYSISKQLPKNNNNIYINKPKGSQRSKKKKQRKQPTQRQQLHQTEIHSFKRICVLEWENTVSGRIVTGFTIHVHILFDSNALSEKKPLNEGWFRFCFNSRNEREQ